MDGTPVQIVMKITGHETFEAFSQYVRLQEIQATLKFKKSSLLQLDGYIYGR